MDKNDQRTRTPPTSPRTKTQNPPRQRLVAKQPTKTRENRNSSAQQYRPHRPGHHPPVVLNALSAATSAALAGLAVAAAMVLIGWAADPHTQASTSGALRAAAQVWLVSHHGTFRLPSGNIGLLPMGLAILPAILLLRAGTSLARSLKITDLLIAIQATAALAGSYGLFVVIICAAAATKDVGAAPVQTLLGASLLAFVAGGAGVVRGSALWRRAFLVLSPHARLVIRASGVGAGVLIAVGALLAGVSFIFDLGLAVDLFHALAPGIVEGLALLLLNIAYVPNAALWGTAFAVGPGFAVGAGTQVSASGVRLGEVPAFPLLAALPEGDHPSIAAYISLAGPLLAGILIGVFLVRRLRTGDYGVVRIRAAAGWAALSGIVAGVALGIGAAFAGGSLGNGRLAEVGPSPWRVAIFASLELAVTASLVAAVMCGAHVLARRWKAQQAKKASKTPADLPLNAKLVSDPELAKKPKKQKKKATNKGGPSSDAETKPSPDNGEAAKESRPQSSPNSDESRDDSESTADHDGGASNTESIKQNPVDQELDGLFVPETDEATNQSDAELPTEEIKVES